MSGLKYRMLETTKLMLLCCLNSAVVVLFIDSE